MHAVLCTSATHLANFATKVNDEAKALHFAAVAAQNRAQALHLLRIASPNQEGFDEEVNAATMVILTLSGVGIGRDHFRLAHRRSSGVTLMSCLVFFHIQQPYSSESLHQGKILCFRLYLLCIQCTLVCTQ